MLKSTNNIKYNKELPKWSVMIPTYNCANLLEQALLSVLQKDPGEELMQIEVIDDCSTKDDPEEVVNRIGNGRVTFFKQPKNVGAIKNFNTCIDNSRGELVHILHGDDWVERGFYNEIENLSTIFPNASLYATRSFFVNEKGVIASVSNELLNLRAPSTNNEDFYYDNPLQFAGVVVRKKFYLENQKFDENLIHTADVDMWSRAIFYGGGVVSQKVLSNYRVFDGNDTSTLKKNAKNLEDLKRLGSKFKELYPSFSEINFNKKLIGLCKLQIRMFLEAQESSAAKMNYKFLKKNASLSQFYFFTIKHLFSLLKNYKKTIKKTIKSKQFYL